MLIRHCLITAAAISCMYFFKGQLTSSASYALYPLLRMQHRIQTHLHTRAQHKQSVETLTKQLELLRTHNQHLQDELIQLHATQTYEDAIKPVQAYRARYAHAADACVAQILWRSFTERQHIAYVDAGANKGIEPDMVVLHGTCLVGKVVEVYHWYSKILFITDRSCKVAAFCAQTKTQGIHEGNQNKHQSSLAFVSHLDPVHEGDMILSSGQGMVFPHGFGLGTIKTTQPNMVTQTITVQPLVDLNQISFCAICSKSNLS